MEADGYGRDLHNYTICTCQLAVTTVITSAGLLGLYAGKSVNVHNCLR